jgi:hypothetical protein
MGVRMQEAVRRRVLASFPPGISGPERRHLLRERFYGDTACGSKTQTSAP